MDRKPWFRKQKWYQAGWTGPIIPASKEGWLLTVVFFLIFFFFIVNIGQPVANNFSVATNAVGALLSFIIFGTVAALKS